jgi:cyclase
MTYPMHSTSATRWLFALALMLAAGPWVHTLGAQQPATGAGGLETIEIRPNLYVIFGAGSNITAQVGEDGVILVDSGSAEMAEQVVAAVEAITDRPIRLIINTSADADHVGGNAGVGAAGLEINPDNFSNETHATVLSHENVLLRMSGSADADVSFESWPTETYTSRTRTMYLNAAPLQILREVGAHSDGDSVVFFRQADVIATGDILDLRHFPNIDPANGGSIQGELDALNRLLEITIPSMPLVLKPGRTLLVPGHGRISDYAELVEYRDMVTIVRDNIQALVEQGQTLEQVQAANPTAGYRGRYGVESGPWTTEMFVEAIYNSLKSSMEKL